MPDIAELEVKVKSDSVAVADRALRGFSVTATTAQGAADKLGGVLGAAAGGVNLLRSSITTLLPIIGLGGAAGLLGGLASIAVVSQKAISAYVDLEREQKIINSLILASGSAAGRTLPQIEELGAKLGNPDAVRRGATALLQFQSVSREVFDRTLTAARQMAKLGFGEVEDAAFKLGMALENPEEGMNRLRRSGIILNQTEKQTISDLQHSGQMYKAQEALLDAVQKRIGTSTGGDTLAGAYKGLSVATNDLLEQWGEQITKATNLAARIRDIRDAVDKVRVITSAKPTLAGLNAEIASIEAKLTALEAREKAGLANAPKAGQVTYGAISLRQATDSRRALDAEKNYQTEEKRLLLEQKALIEERRDNLLQEQNLEAFRRSLAETQAADAEKQRKADLVETERLRQRREFEKNQRTDLRQAQYEALKNAELLDATGNIPRRPDATQKAIMDDVARAYGAARTRIADFNDIVERGKSSLSSMNLEYAVLGKSVGETQRLTLQHQLLEEAQKNGRKATESEREAIDKLADAMGRLAQRNAEAKLAADVMFDRSQIFRTDVDQQIASKLRSVYGDNYLSFMDSVIAQQMRFNDQLKFTSDLGKDALKGFLSDLRNGKSIGEATMNAINRGLDKLLDRSLDQLWGALFGGGRGGGGGGLFGWLFGGLFGGGGIPGAGMNAQGMGFFHRGGQIGWDGLPRAHVGAMIGNSGLFSNERPIIAQVGERIVTPQQWEDKGGGIVMQGHTVIVQGDASEKTIGLITQALEQYDKGGRNRTANHIAELRRRSDSRVRRLT